MAREKGSVPGTGKKKKAAWGHTDLSAVVSSARKKKLGVFMCLPLWGGRKVNYQHVNKEENPVQQCRGYRWGPSSINSNSAASKPEVMTTAGQIKQACFSYLKTISSCKQLKPLEMHFSNPIGWVWPQEQ